MTDPAGLTSSAENNGLGSDTARTSPVEAQGEILSVPAPFTTTLKRIRAHSPCSDGWAKLLAGLGKTAADDEPLAYADILRINGVADALWCCRAEPQYDREWRLFACWCARQNWELLTDPRSRAAVECAERFANGRATVSELDAAWAAASAAAWASWAAARAAARAAAWAAADAAARAAADAAARAAAARAAVDAAADAAAGAAADAAAGAAADAAARAAARAAQSVEFLCVVSGQRGSQS